MSSPTELRRALSKTLLVCLAALALASCGYGFGADSASVLEPPSPGTLPTLKIKSVENPTLYPWLPHILRAEVRDEIAARDIAHWVDSGKADYEISIKVARFTNRSWLTDPNDITLLYNVDMALEAIVYRGDSNEEIWRSGQISYSQSYEQIQERVAGGEITRELARRLASAMQHAF